MIVRPSYSSAEAIRASLIRPPWRTLMLLGLVTAGCSNPPVPGPPRRNGLRFESGTTVRVGCKLGH
jgi:hypothetical protein